jgi:translation initiation factor IF-3
MSTNDFRNTPEGPRVNESIRYPKIRVIDENGEMLGVMTPQEGMRRAFELSLDLIEISPHSDPPVCKILDSGKYKYELQKKKAEARKKQKIVEIKEIKMRPVIDINDYNVKMRSVNKFLAEGDKVKVTMRFRGREMSHQELGMDVLNRVKADLEDVAKVEQQPKPEGRQIMMILAPKV